MEASAAGSAPATSTARRTGHRSDAEPGGSTIPDEFSVSEYEIEYPPERRPSDGHGSTHELALDPRGDALWITGQDEATIVRAGFDGTMQTFELPDGSGPHGIVFDVDGELWVTLEFAGSIARLDRAGSVVEEIDVRIVCTTCATPINPHPHGLAVGADGRTLWFTGKSTGTIGRIGPARAVTTFPVTIGASAPIYIEAGTDGNMWFTELVGNAIGRITPAGAVTEFSIPTPNSRPISLVRDPRGRGMWFSEEAGNRVAHVSADGVITEFPVPKAQDNVILAALAFDDDGALWVQQYVDQHHPQPAGPDHVVRIGPELLDAPTDGTDELSFTFVPTPTEATVMHRIILGPDDHLWFTELATNRLGRITGS